MTNKQCCEKAVIEGYAVKWHDGEVTVFQRKPTKLIGDDKTFCGWHSQDGCKLFLPKDSLPSVTCENSPQRVKIEINLIYEERSDKE